MKKRRLSITQTIMQDVMKAIENRQNDVTRKAYLRNTKKYIYFCREMYDCKTYEECRSYIQDYADCLVDKGYTASTIHTYVAAVCAAFNVKMNTIHKPKRIVAEFVRNRNPLPDARACQDLTNPKWSYIVEFQKRVGIRREELRRLTGKDFIRTQDGCFVFVARGKGGKAQMQRVLPHDENFIENYFKDKKTDERIFEDKYFKNALPFHLLRAQHAKECYDYLLEQIKQNPAFEQVLERDIRERWRDNKDKNGRVKPFPEDQIRGYYVLRGKCRKLARKKGLPTSYSRLVTMWVSMFVLSHFRLNVTIQNYFLV